MLNQIPPSSEETETSLIILSDTPDLISTKILALQEVKDYNFQRIDKIKHIHDTYFDTNDDKGSLQEHKIVLRIRKIEGNNEQTLVTLKELSKQEEWGSSSRLEFEEPLSKSSLNTILDKIKEKIPTIALPRYDGNFDSANEKVIMERIGLHAIQNRTTERNIMNIYSKKDSSLFAELDVDYTLYNLTDDEQIGYYNVEIELKGPNKSIKDLEMLNKELIFMYQPDLKIWEYSKFTTGKAIKKLHERRILNGLVNHINTSVKNLKPAAFEKIDRLIRVEGI
jgi:inorganic triphosphatase YgiF